MLLGWRDLGEGALADALPTDPTGGYPLLQEP
jgi:hypothetical protein